MHIFKGQTNNGSRNSNSKRNVSGVCAGTSGIKRRICRNFLFLSNGKKLFRHFSIALYGN